MQRILNQENPVIEALAEELEKRIKTEDPQANVERKTVEENNGVKMEAVFIRSADPRVGTNLYLDSAAEKVEQGQLEMREAVDVLFHKYKKQMKHCPDYDDIMAKIQDENNLYAVVVNRDANLNNLARCPHIDIENTRLTILPRIKVRDDASALVTNELCGHMQKTGSAVLETAIKNTTGIDRWNVRTMREQFSEMLDVPSEEMLDEIFPSAIPPMVVVTPKDELMGAVGSFICADVRKKIAEKLGCEPGENYLIIPSSIYEVIAAKEGELDWEMVNGMIQEVNESMVAKEERLGNHCYRVDDKLRVSLAGPKVEQIEKNNTQSLMRIV